MTVYVVTDTSTMRVAFFANAEKYNMSCISLLYRLLLSTKVSYRNVYNFASRVETST